MSVIPGTLYSRSNSFLPSCLVLLGLCRGQLSAQSAAQFPCSVPLSPDAPSRAQRKVLLTHRRCSRAAALAWLATHSGPGSPPLRVCNAGRYSLTAAAGPSLPDKSSAKENRALLFRGKTPSSRDTSCSLPWPRPLRREIWCRRPT